MFPYVIVSHKIVKFDRVIAKCIFFNVRVLGFLLSELLSVNVGPVQCRAQNYSDYASEYKGL